MKLIQLVTYHCLEQTIPDLGVKYKQKRLRLEQQKPILLFKDMFHTSSTVPNCEAEILHVPCQYCGSADHYSNACSQAEVCPLCMTKNHSLMYICPLSKEVKNQEKDYRL